MIISQGTIMLTSADIEKRIKMSQADCIITDIHTASKVNECKGSTLKKKILVFNEEDEVDKDQKEKIEKMTAEGWM